MRILVTFAVDEEFGPWRGRHRFETVRLGDLAVDEARIGGAQVAVLLTGIGPKIARSNVMGVLAARSGSARAFDFCISAGLAGALRPEYNAGDILAAGILSAPEEAGGREKREVASHPVCLQLAGECGAHIVGRFKTTRRMILTSGEKTNLSAEADAVDMESFAVLDEAQSWGLKGVAIRAVGDTASEDAPLDFNRAIDEQGKVRPGRMLALLLERPRALPKLLHFARQSRDAAIALADYMDKYVVALATRQPEAEIQQEEVIAAT